MSANSRGLVTNESNIETSREASRERAGEGASWTFLTNHSHVLICLSQEPQPRLRDVAQRVGITERAVQRIVSDLEDADVLTRSRDGRRNSYEIHTEKPLRHAIEAHCKINDLLKIVAS